MVASSSSRSAKSIASRSVASFLSRACGGGAAIARVRPIATIAAAKPPVAIARIAGVRIASASTVTAMVPAIATAASMIAARSTPLRFRTSPANIAYSDSATAIRLGSHDTG